MAKRELTPEVREYFREIGRKRGNALKAKYGSDYFKQIAAKRKSFGRKPAAINSVVELGKRFGVSRQRIAQILDANGSGHDITTFADIGMWRQAVITEFFKNKTAEKPLDTEQA